MTREAGRHQARRQRGERRRRAQHQARHHSGADVADQQISGRAIGEGSQQLVQKIAQEVINLSRHLT